MKSLYSTFSFIFAALFSHNALAQGLEITNIRVGQGDSTLIQGPVKSDGSRINVLFDAADISAYDGGKVIGAVLARKGITKIDYLIISHYDVDHIGGVVSGGVHGSSFLLGRNQTPGANGDDDNDGNNGWVGAANVIPDREELGEDDDISVGKFVDRGDNPVSSTLAYRKYVALASAMGSRVSLSNPSTVNNFEIELGEGAKMTALAGNGFVRGNNRQIANVDTENERSLSFLVTYGTFDFLISGDMIGRTYGQENAQVETAVGEVIRNMNRTVDVLHVNHHGADNASEVSFLEKIKPTIAIISSGNDNDHHHPNKNALKRLEQAGVYRIIQTAWGTTEEIMPPEIRRIQAIYQNDIVISSNGREFTISTSRTFANDQNPRRH